MSNTGGFQETHTRISGFRIRRTRMKKNVQWGKKKRGLSSDKSLSDRKKGFMFMNLKYQFYQHVQVKAFFVCFLSFILSFIHTFIWLTPFKSTSFPIFVNRLFCCFPFLLYFCLISSNILTRLVLLEFTTEFDPHCGFY